MTKLYLIRAKCLQILIVFAFLMAAGGIVQGQTMSGTVLSASNNQPLNGVTVQLEGSTRATVTDGAGYYGLSDVPASDSLTFSLVGFRTQVVAVNGCSIVDISLTAIIVRALPLLMHPEIITTIAHR